MLILTRRVGETVMVGNEVNCGRPRGKGQSGAYREHRA